MGGTNKLLLPFPDLPVVRCSVERALESGVDPVGVVVDSPAGDVAGALEGLPIELLVNPEPESGVSTSVRRATVWALKRGSALVLTLADEPGLDPSAVEVVIERWVEADAPMVRARYEDRPGHPVLVSLSALQEVPVLRGDRGFGTWLRGARADEVSIPGRAPIDIDDEADYLAALARLAH